VSFIPPGRVFVGRGSSTTIVSPPFHAFHGSRRSSIADENISLSAVIDEEHEFHLSDKLEQDTIPAADFVFLRTSLRRHVQQALDELDEKEEKVLRLRFGLDGADPKTLKEIGELMSLSRERIRQIEAQALEKLNRSQKCQQLRGYLN